MSIMTMLSFREDGKTLSEMSSDELMEELDKWDSSRKATVGNYSWANIIYQLAIEVDDRRDKETYSPERGIWCKLPFIAESMITGIGNSFDEYYVTFSHNREGYFSLSLYLEDRPSTFETVVGIKGDGKAFLLFRDRYGHPMPSLREICYEFANGQFTGKVDYYWSGKQEEYPEDRTKPIDQHFFPHFFHPAMKRLPQHVQPFFGDYVRGSEIPKDECLWDKTTIEKYVAADPNSNLRAK